MGWPPWPIGALLAQAHQPWQIGLITAMTLAFMPLLQPTNPMNYDPLLFYNVALAVVAGAGAAALSFRLLPPLSPAFRSARLLALTLHGLRRIAAGRTITDWEGNPISTANSSAVAANRTLLPLLLDLLRQF